MSPLDPELLRQAADFVHTREDVEASIMRIGLHNTQVVLVAADGEWLRFVVASPRQAESFCKRLKVEHHEGYPEPLRRRIGAYRRSRADWAEAPYPEQSRGSST
jgi:hypothetical protein